jgi:signal transduction histidine kinase/ActR/RegA family two-component response regulator
VTGIPLRRRLFVLTATGVLPLALLAGSGLFALARVQDVRVERVGLEVARSVGSAVDAELRSLVAVLETLATTRSLDDNDLAGFRDLAERVLEPKPEWAAIVLADRRATSLVDTRSAESPLPGSLSDSESFNRVLNTRVPVIGALTRHENNAWLFAVRVPVIRAGEVRYVLTALVRPGAIRDVLLRRQVAGDWIVSIVDAHGRRVARSRAHEENLGGRLSDSVQKVVDQGGTEGFGLATSLEGERIFTPYSRLAASGWTVVLGIPTSLVQTATYRSLAVYSGGVLLSIALGTLAALWVARSITRPIADLRGAAEALGRREPPSPPVTSIQEIRDVGAALKDAADALSRVEAQHQDLLRKERHARETAETADRVKEEFLAVLSHELRTPLNAVYGWARMLQRGEIRDEALIARAKDAIVRNADVQVQLIDDLLDLSRISTGKMRLDIRAVDVQAVLQGAVDAVRPAADAKGIRIETTIDPAPGSVTGDPGRLQQVVWNLLMNAVKFTPRGGRVRLRLTHVDSHLEIVVSDTGQGIAPEMLPHVFERFRQADSSSTRMHGGLGLGLALVKHLVELHGGTVMAMSDGPGQGATFIVRLPVGVADVPVESAPRYPDADESIADIVRLDGLRVVVADDDRDAIMLAEAILKSAGAEVRTCLTAADALDWVRRWRPDVLVSDIEMPGEDGYSLIRNVRALGPEEGGDTPAIALTAYGGSQDRLRSLAAGFTMHVPKPVDPGELTAIVAGVAQRLTTRLPSTRVSGG